VHTYHFIRYSTHCCRSTADNQSAQSAEKAAPEKRVSFGDVETILGGSSKEETVRNFYMMESTSEEKPNFLMGGEEVEDKDEFPTENSTTTNGGLQKQLSDAMLIDKRRRLR